jgi:hypothetical protein
MSQESVQQIGSGEEDRRNEKRGITETYLLTLLLSFDADPNGPFANVVLEDDAYRICPQKKQEKEDKIRSRS